MSDAKKPATEKSFEERKKALIAQGAECRKKVDASIAVVRENLHADKLAKSAMNHITAKAYGAVDRLFGRHHGEKADLGMELGADRASLRGDTGLASRFANLTNENHAAGKLIAQVRRFLPLATTAFTILRRRQMVMPVVRGAAVLGGIGAGAYFFHRHRQRMQALEEETDAMQYAYQIEPPRVQTLDGQG